MTINVKIVSPARPPSSTRRISATSRAPSAPSSTATSRRARPGSIGSRRFSPSSVPASSSWSATTTPAPSPPTARPARTTARRCCGRWLLLIPVLYVNQEMVLRLGAVTGVGHARLIFERFGKFWGAFSVIDLFLLNALTIVTEFIGISARARLSRPRQDHGRRRRRRADHRGGQHRQLPAFRALLDDAGLRQSAAACPIYFMVHPPLAQVAHDLVVPQIPGDRQDERRDAARHRHRRHHGRALAAVLPAELRHRQAHHAALHPLRAARPVDRHRARHRRRRRDHGLHGGDLRRPGRVRRFHRRGRHRRRHREIRRQDGGRDVRDRADRRGDHRRGGGVAVDRLRDRRHLLGAPLAAPPSHATPRASTPSTSC